MADPIGLDSEAQRALSRARQLASSRGLPSARPEDLILALLEPHTRSASLVRLFCADVAQLARAAESLVLAAKPGPVARDVERHTTELAREEALRLGHDTIASEHLLLGLMRQPRTLAAAILFSLGMQLDSARDAARLVHAQVGDAERLHRAVVPMEKLPNAARAVRPDHDFLGSAGFAKVEASPLDRVVAIGKVASASGMLIEVIALEIREAGAILYWNATSDDERIAGGPDVVVTDDAGTSYATRRSRSSGTLRRMSGQVIIIPSPPPSAKTMRIDIPSFGGGPRPPTLRLSVQTNPILGPWTVAFSLRSDQ